MGVRGFAVGMVLLLGQAIFLPISSSAAGWNDFHVRLDDEFGLLHLNSLEVTISVVSPNPHRWGGTPLIIPRGWPELNLGPLARLYWNTDCFLVVHYGTKPRPGAGTSSVPDVDIEKLHRFVIDRASRAVLGPFEDAAFEKALADCNAPLDVPWMSVREAYRYSFRAYPEQRFERSHVHNAMFRAMLVAIFMTAVCLPVSVLLAGILYVVRRIRRRRWPILRYAVGAWIIPPLLFSGLTAINGVFVLW